ncbi:MAG: hypothetical protein WA825_12945 [Steroidobacteraceae bacterium]
MRAIIAALVVVSAGLLLLGGLPVLSASASDASAPDIALDGSKHSAGPKPARLSSGRPNWTGFWVPVGGLLEGYHGPSGVEGRPGGVASNTAQLDPTMPEMKSPYKEQFEGLLARARNGEELPDKPAACFPPGMPKMMVMIYGMEVLQTPKIIALTSEYQAATRRIWMDLKNHPAADELEDTYTGHSIGHWEGDTLVVDTVGIRPDVSYLRHMEMPHSRKTRIVERFHQTAPDTLVDDMTLMDPDVFEKSWIKSYTYHYRPDLRIEEYVCLDNNRNVDAQGRGKF